MMVRLKAPGCSCVWKIQYFFGQVMVFLHQQTLFIRGKVSVSADTESWCCLRKVSESLLLSRSHRAIDGALVKYNHSDRHRYRHVLKAGSVSLHHVIKQVLVALHVGLEAAIMWIL